MRLPSFTALRIRCIRRRQIIGHSVHQGQCIRRHRLQGRDQVDWAKKSVKGLNIRNSSGFLSPNNASFFAPKPSYSSSSSAINNGQNDKKQRTVRKKVTTFS